MGYKPKIKNNHSIPRRLKPMAKDITFNLQITLFKVLLFAVTFM
jgi:hypothetical protein